VADRHRLDARIDEETGGRVDAELLEELAQRILRVVLEGSADLSIFDADLPAGGGDVERWLVEVFFDVGEDPFQAGGSAVGVVTG